MGDKIMNTINQVYILLRLTQHYFNLDLQEDPGHTTTQHVGQ